MHLHVVIATHQRLIEARNLHHQRHDVIITLVEQHVIAHVIERRHELTSCMRLTHETTETCVLVLRVGSAVVLHRQQLLPVEVVALDAAVLQVVYDQTARCQCEGSVVDGGAVRHLRSCGIRAAA